MISFADEPVQSKSVRLQDCKLYLFVSLGVSLFTCAIAIGLVSFSLLRNRRKNLSTSIPAIAPPSIETRRSKEPLHISASSSGSETFYTSSDVSSIQSDLRKLPVPSTVKRRKKQVNAELMGLFANENMMPYASSYPPLLNYYGYVVVPRSQASHQKKSLRAMKRNARARVQPSFDYNSGGFQEHAQVKSECSCKKDKADDGILDDTEEECQSNNHTSIIRITSGPEIRSGNGHPFHVERKPQPRPRVVSNPDHIYTEIQEDIPPTLV